MHIDNRSGNKVLNTFHRGAAILPNNFIWFLSMYYTHFALGSVHTKIILDYFGLFRNLRYHLSSNVDDWTLKILKLVLGASFEERNITSDFKSI